MAQIISFHRILNLLQIKMFSDVHCLLKLFDLGKRGARTKSQVRFSTGHVQMQVFLMKLLLNHCNINCISHIRLE